MYATKTKSTENTNSKLGLRYEIRNAKSKSTDYNEASIMRTGYKQISNNANVEKYRIPIAISRYFEILIPNTEPTFKNTEKPISTSNTADTDPRLIPTY